MNLVDNIVINTYSIILLIIINIYSIKQDEKETLQHKLYTIMLQVTMLLLVVDIFSRFDGMPDTSFTVINRIGNFTIFVLNIVLPSLWLLYVHYQVFQDEIKTKKLVLPLVTLNAINAYLVILSQFFGWFYYIDENNIYHRGKFFLLPVIIMISLIAFSYFLIIIDHKQINKKYLFSLAFFGVPPILCMLLQIHIYGISLALNGVVVSLLVVFLSIQNRSINFDYLTEVYNRKRLEAYLKEKVATSTQSETFSAIMLDMDDFKLINDTYGHDMGDNVIKTAAGLLKSCIGNKGFIARYGGDEFCIVLDISDIKALEAIVCKVNSCIDEFNNLNTLPCKINFSMGYDVYDYYLQMSVEEFKKHIDTLMYENKKIKREKQ